jgi:hypothetical protein
MGNAANEKAATLHRAATCSMRACSYRPVRRRSCPEMMRTSCQVRLEAANRALPTNDAGREQRSRVFAPVREPCERR